MVFCIDYIETNEKMSELMKSNTIPIIKHEKEKFTIPDTATAVSSSSYLEYRERNLQKCAENSKLYTYKIQ